MTTWTETRNGRAYAFPFPEMPNVAVFTVRDDDAETPDGDGYAPTLVGSDWGTRDYVDARSVYVDSEVTRAYLRACDHYGEMPAHPELAARYMRAFYETEIATASSWSDRYANVVIFDTPAWRAHCGILSHLDVMTRANLMGDVETWQAYLDGEVYGIGYVIVADPDDDDDVETFVDDGSVDVWGFYGTEYAREAAVEECAIDPETYGSSYTI